MCPRERVCRRLHLRLCACLWTSGHPVPGLCWILVCSSTWGSSEIHANTWTRGHCGHPGAPGRGGSRGDVPGLHTLFGSQPSLCGLNPRGTCVYALCWRSRCGAAELLRRSSLRKEPEDLSSAARSANKAKGKEGGANKMLRAHQQSSRPKVMHHVKVDKYLDRAEGNRVLWITSAPRVLDHAAHRAHQCDRLATSQGRRRLLRLGSLGQACRHQ